ncbi:uncharacterized protein [Ptychodera flava]|uniref:uncharacterized protein n=1 Tax=Ptychodera flava TaxID=63121 RepID=UPI00396A96D2
MRMLHLTVTFISFAATVVGTNAGIITVDEKGLASIVQKLQEPEEQCSTPGHFFCDPPTDEDCEVAAGCKNLQACSEVVCSKCPHKDPGVAARICKYVDAVQKILKTGVIDFNVEGATLTQKYIATLKLVYDEFDVCGDGRIVCDEVKGGCVDFDDACNDDGKDCVCGLQNTINVMTRTLTQDGVPYIM